jgi:hypothetical protein
VPIGLPPNGLGLGLNTSNSIEYHYSTVQHPQTSFYFGSEINMTGCIDDIYTVTAPLSSGSGRSYGNTALTLQIHEVHHRCTLINVTNLVRTACEKQHTLGNRGLTGVYVGYEPYVTDFAKVRALLRLSHGVL